MTIKWMKWLLPLLVLGLGIGCMQVIKATAKDKLPKALIDDRPTVPVSNLTAQDHRVILTSFGEVTPSEITHLAAQVSGEVLSWNPNFTAGGLVKRGDILFSIEKDKYQAALLQAEAQLNQAQANFIEEQAKAKVAESEASRLSKEVSDLYLRKPQVMSAQAAVKSAQASLQLAKRDLDDCDIKAPYDALVISRELGVGQYISAGAKIAILNNVEQAEIVFPIANFDTEFLPEQLHDLPAKITVKGQAKMQRQARIIRDLGVVDDVTRMSQLVAHVSDPYSLNHSGAPLKFGSYVEVKFEGILLRQVYKVPQDVVNHQSVWLVNNKNQLEPRKVTIAREEGAFFFISEGLTDEDVLVMTPPDYPQIGMEVKPVLIETQLVQR